MTLLRTVLPEQITPRRAPPIARSTLQDAQSMLDEIEQGGEGVALRFAQRFGDIEPDSTIVYTPRALQSALDALQSQHRCLLERIAERIRRFALAQLRCIADLEMPIPGGAAGHTLTPVRSAGCYAPGGRYPLPSSVLMTAIPARVAGVASVVVASPRPTPVTLAAAAVAGADALIAVGGVQAIGALAHGLLGSPQCDLIVGPGNRWVTAAKHCVSSFVGIDMLAGPSELVILADDSADAGVIATDLLAQAEHDVDAAASLVTTSAVLARAVELELARLLPTLPGAAIAERSLVNGRICVVRDDDEAVDVCNRLAPEHLEVIHRRERELALRLDRCGAIFVGAGAAEVIGDYGAGPNHTLPTGGTARFRAGLSVYTFLKPTTWIRIDDPAPARSLYEDAAACARLESLEGHARSAESRLSHSGASTLA